MARGVGRAGHLRRAVFTRIPESPGAGRLGRHIHHDPRSLRYRYRPRRGAELTSVRHVRHVPVLDQGDLGSCTGHAALGCIGTGALYAAVSADNPSRPTGNADRDGRLAVELYSAATRLDRWPGEWPPEDTGSDGLSVAKAAQRAGLISGYRHATSLEDALAALARQPVITGVPWYSSMDHPDSAGVVHITSDAFLRGGHEFVLDELDVERRLVGLTNSWGPDWGRGGRAYLPWSDFARLLGEDGDVTVFVPADHPAPKPSGGLCGLVRDLLDWL